MNDILDNEQKGKEVHKWIAQYTEEGTFDVVTGYFTIGALAYLSGQINDKISRFRMVLGDISNVSSENFRPLDLLNENITVDAAVKLQKYAKEAVKFLKHDKVLTKTLEPNFCHAKLYMYKNIDDDMRKPYYISGSSNLTEAGIGLKKTSNVELNIANLSLDSQYEKLAQWFENLWHSPKAHIEKTVKLENGKEKKMPFKDYLIGEIAKIFKEYSPKDIYYKILFELFGNQLANNDPNFNRQMGRLQNSAIYTALYDFQKKGTESLIRMLEDYNGAILADAVGLGKTWTSLAVIKFYQLQGRETILLCPKKLEQNWRQYLKNQDSKFEKDEFDYFIRFHTDMSTDRLETYNDRGDKFFTNDKPKLLVVDESHNLRNDKSIRYKFLMENILQKNADIKVLLLSATPINNSLLDVRNQFKMLVQGNIEAFKEKLDIGNLDYLFRKAQAGFNQWTQEIDPKISDFVQQIPPHYFKLSDTLTVARTRKMITDNHNANLYFPQKEKPENYYITPNQLGNFDSFGDLIEHFPPMLSGYQPAFYVKETEKKEVIHDEKLRDRFLVKMMYILMAKRLESSWFSFFATVKKISEHHQNALDKIRQYEENKQNTRLADIENDGLFDEDDSQEFETLSIGTKREITLKEIDESGYLQAFKKDLKTDLNALDLLQTNLQKFENQINNENSNTSKDLKLEKLIEIIKRKQASENKKMVIFTVYKDTAEYLFTELKKRGFNHLAMTSGSYCLTDDCAEQMKKIEPILQRFAPYTKLFKEKEWEKFVPQAENETEKYTQWRQWLQTNKPDEYKKIENQIDILISTDVLSEGQNLQDADMVINYDIHWNPVRIIQRMGRIDRLGSPNDKIFGVNFFPSNDINDYLNLQKRVEDRMIGMKLMGSELPDFTKSLQEKLNDDLLDQRQNARMLKQMQTKFDDIENQDNAIGFDSFSLENFRQDFMAEINRQGNIYQNMPKGVFTGFQADSGICKENGIIALLKYRNAVKEKQPFELIYINEQGISQLQNQKEVLDILAYHKDFERYVPQSVDLGEEKTIEKLSSALKTWIKNQAKPAAENQVIDIFVGNVSPQEMLAEEKTEEKFTPANFDLIAWVVVGEK